MHVSSVLFTNLDILDELIQYLHNYTGFTLIFSSISTTQDWKFSFELVCNWAFALSCFPSDVSKWAFLGINKEPSKVY